MKCLAFWTVTIRKPTLQSPAGEIVNDITDVLRRDQGISHDLIMFYMTPTKRTFKPENVDRNIFSVTCQLMYSKDNTS